MDSDKLAAEATEEQKKEHEEWVKMSAEDKKELEAWVVKRSTIIECCRLNDITPTDFLAVALGIIVTEYKRNGRSIQDVANLFTSTVKEAQENWEKI